jgi:hypothetical protein
MWSLRLFSTGPAYAHGAGVTEFGRKARTSKTPDTSGMHGMHDLQQMGKLVMRESIKSTLVFDGKPLTMEEYLSLPVPKKGVCKKKTHKILPAATENASFVLDGRPVAFKEYAYLSSSKRKKCRKETLAIWPVETVLLLTKNPEAKKVLQVPAKPLLEECHIELING